MFIAVLSVNHKLASVAVREKIAFSPNIINNALQELKQQKTINGCVILSTCNRLEIYISSDNIDNKQILVNFLANYHELEVQYIDKYLDYFQGDKAINHICSVASGLDSMVLGEPQILGQLKDAYNVSKQNNTLNTILDKLFQHTFSVAKKVRTNTDIGKNPVSIAYCGIKLTEKIFSTLTDKTALLIGAGEMIELSAQHLSNKNIKNMIIANRTKQNAEKISQKYNAKAINLNQISDYIHRSDILITSTAAPIAIIGKGLIESAIKKRKHKPMFILDIAVPRDVEEEVSSLNDIYLYTVDDLNSVINSNIENRNQAKAMALEIIQTQNNKFNRYLNNIPKHNLIKNYRQNADSIKNNLLNNTLVKITTKLKNKNIDENLSQEIQELVSKLADQLTNKLIHKNFINIKNIDKKNLDMCKNCIPKKI